MDLDLGTDLEGLERAILEGLEEGLREGGGSYNYNYEYNFGGEELLESLAPIGVAFAVFWALFSLCLIALSVVAYWFLFKKAGEPGWAAVVPFYNSYTLFKITWGTGWLFLLLLIPIANIVIWIITMVKLSKAFGQGGGWACGLIFLTLIFLCIMAFSKSFRYVGVPDARSPDMSQMGGANQGFQGGPQNAQGGSTAGFYAAPQPYQPPIRQSPPPAAPEPTTAPTPQTEAPPQSPDAPTGEE